MSKTDIRMYKIRTEHKKITDSLLMKYIETNDEKYLKEMESFKKMIISTQPYKEPLST